MQNPLLNPGIVPAFDQIKPEHFLPALETVCEKIQKDVAAIKGNLEAPTFENTVVPLEKLFHETNYIQMVLNNYCCNVSTPELEAIQEKSDIMTSDLSKNIYQDSVLGDRFRAVYEQRASLNLDQDDLALLKKQHSSFESSGALLSPEGQQRIREIDQSLITLAKKFVENIRLSREEQQPFLVTDEAELAGIPEENIAVMKKQAEKAGHTEGWLFVPERLLVDETLSYAENREFRQKIFEAMENVGKIAPYDNAPILKEIHQLRHEYATLLGYEHYAAFAASRSMQTDLQAVRNFLTEVTERAMPVFEQEMRELETFSAEHGGPAKLEPWDTPFWIGQQRKALYDFDVNAFSKHLEMENMLAGLLNEASRIHGVDFNETSKYPKLHPDMRVYEAVNSGTGELEGILYADLYARQAKIGGAWMNQFQHKQEDRPSVVVINMNLTKPEAGKKSFVPVDQYQTTYHENGHGMHGLLGVNVKYVSQQGTNCPADFVEIHSTINEERAFLPQNLEAYALHTDTGLPPSAEDVVKLRASLSHFAKLETLKIVQNSLWDLQFHSVSPEQYGSDIAVQNSVLSKSPYARHVRPYSLTRFDHLFSQGHSSYAAGYVKYLIAEKYAVAAYTAFEKDPYNPELLSKLDAFYRRGSGGDHLEVYKQLTGGDAPLEPLLKKLGVESAGASGGSPITRPTPRA